MMKEFNSLLRNGWREQRTLNFIERYWCGCKWYALEDCLCTITDLRETVLKDLNSVSLAKIHRYYLRGMRTIDTYAAGVAYGTEELKERVYKGHRQVVDKSKAIAIHHSPSYLGHYIRILACFCPPFLTLPTKIGSTSKSNYSSTIIIKIISL